MTSKRYFYILIGIFGLLVALILAGTIGGNILFEKQSKKLNDLKIENAAIEMQQSALVQAKKDIDKYSELEKITKSIVPQDKDQAKTVREIVQIAQANGIPIQSVSFESSNLGEPSKTTGAAKPSPVTQATPVEGITGVYSIPIDVSAASLVDYETFLQFLESLEKNRRTAHVNAISLKPTADGKKLEFNLTLNAYVKP